MRLPSFLLALLIGGVAAQDHPSPAALTEDLFAPIHTLPGCPEYGIWAAGRDFKVGFEGHFRFVPYLGPSYATNQSFDWKTVSVRIGSEELAVGPAAGQCVGATRYEYDHGAVVEAYHVSSDRVEQTFEVEFRPAGGGDLVVVGRVTTPLRSTPTGAAHSAITFSDGDGRPIVEYGAATAIDARGRSFPMTSRWDGESITLRLDAASVEAAVFPLIVDPTVLSTSTSADVGMVAIAARRSDGLQRQVAFTRIASQGDHDVFALRCGPGWRGNTLVFDDITTAYKTNHVSVTSTSDAFVIAHERRYSNRTEIRVFWQGDNVIAHNVGHNRYLTAVANLQLRSPELGGSVSSPRAILVYDKVGGGTSTVRAQMLDTAGLTITALPILATTGTAVSPAVSPLGGDPEWAVCWALSGSSSSELFVRSVQSNGTVSLRTWRLAQTTSAIYSQPRVAGNGGRYVLTYLRGPRVIGSPSVRALRFDLTRTAANVIVDRTIHIGRRYENGGVAHDSITRSHWMASYTVMDGLARHVEYSRLGYSGRVGNTRVPQTTDRPFAPAVAFGVHDTEHGGWFGAYATERSNREVKGQELPYNAFQGNAGPGGCAPLNIHDSIVHPVVIGSEFFFLQFPFTSPSTVFLMVGFTSRNLPLDPIGMPGCTLTVDPVLAIPAPLDPASGRYRASMPLADDPALLGLSILTQWLWTRPNANALGLVLSDRLRLTLQ